MKRLQKISAFFITGIMFLSVFVMPTYAQESVNISTANEKLYNELINKTEADFIEYASEICENEDSSELVVVGTAMYDRTDISNNELIDLITDISNPYLLRRLAVESYAFREPEIVDSEIMKIIMDENEESDLRTISVSLLTDYMDETQVKQLVNICNDSDGDLAYNTIKAIERMQPEIAVEIATGIYNNYETETAARINIASKVLSRSLEKTSNVRTIDQNLMSKEEFIAKSAEIYNSINDEEVRCAIQCATSNYVDNAVMMLNVEPRATGKQGYAAYRDGVALIEWHGAIITSGSSTANYVFAHAQGPSATTCTTNYTGFLDGNTSKGYYRPSSTTLTSSQRDAVYSTALSIANERIGYVLSTPIRYSISSTATNKYPVSDIIAIRCDGVVEYAYEYNNIRVFGGNTYWNISKVGAGYENEHSGYQMTPSIQANNYMVRMGAL